MVWHLPHQEAIARACPDAAITVLTKRRSRADELFAGSGFVRRVLWLERAQNGEAAGRHDGALGAWRLAADLRPHRFDRRSEERRVGKEWCSPLRFRVSP